MLLQRIVNRLKYDLKEIAKFLGVFGLWLVGAFGVLLIIGVIVIIFANMGDGYETTYLDEDDQTIDEQTNLSE